MKQKLMSAAGLLVVALTVFGCAHYLPQQGWITLIDGDTGFDNWNVTGGGNWRAEGGSIQADKSTSKGASVLVSKKSFKDFQIYAEFWASEDTNSGVYIRCTNPDTVSSASSYEVQIWDKNPNPLYSTGALVNTAVVNPIYKAGGRWNIYEIHAKGSQITVKLNGVVTVSAQDSRFPAGRIGLQFNGGPIKFRKLLVQEL